MFLIIMQLKLSILSFIVTTFDVLFKKSSLTSKSKRHIIYIFQEYYLVIRVITYHFPLKKKLDPGNKSYFCWCFC